MADEPNARAAALATVKSPMTLELDAREAARGLMTAHLRIPVKSGSFILVYPKWIPGEHGPTGPLADLAGLQISANGASLAWRRDLVDLYAFHFNVPSGVSNVDVDFQVLLNAPESMSTNNIAVINWNRDLLYQESASAHDIYVKASIALPAGWDFGTALPVAQRSGDRVDFQEVNLETLVDSPLDCGLYAKHIMLWQSGAATAQIDLFADRPQDFNFPDVLTARYRRMVTEGLALYGARHWNVHHSLLTLSDTISPEGIEHHQSSDNREVNEFFTEPRRQLTDGDLLTHEFSHSWNGKYRRPADLTTANFQIPMRTDLLWVYEGLNEYLGEILSFRSGIRDPKLYPEHLATVYASMDSEPGRAHDSLADTAAAAPYLYEAKGDYPSLRRRAGDFYAEGELLWLDADTIIRHETAGRKSLDDFLHLFAGAPNTAPMVVTYSRGDIERLLNAVVPFDWHGFFQRNVYEITQHPPGDELERAGWKLVYTEYPNVFMEASDKNEKRIDLWYSLGMRLNEDGEIRDVREGSPSWKAGLSPRMKIVAINGQEFDKDLLPYVLKNAQHTTAPTAILTSHDRWYQTYQVDYHGGPLYPHLVRIAGKTDMLAQIMAPRVVIPRLSFRL